MLLRLSAALLAWLLVLSAATAADLRFFRIGTGSVSGTYFRIGGLIADAVSSPPGSRPCEKGGSCGVPGLVALAQTSEGSVSNAEGIISGAFESGFVQSDVAYAAYRGTGVFHGRLPAEELRAIANLYQESIHLVVRAGLDVSSVRDLEGLRVGLDEEGSGTQADARLILEAFGLSEEAIDASYDMPAVALARMRAGELDAMFLVGGYPMAIIDELIRELDARLVPIKGPEADRLVREHAYLAFDIIPFGVYGNGRSVETLGVGAQWIVRADLEEELAYELTRALWHPVTGDILREGHPRGRDITLQTALEGIAIPLHPGAERFYREKGLLGDE
ncbi:TAXI family TRAP transporter solute-binding subunit [Geminicoccaceae bacterium 1502E]|nr:TAXI family TRAP transporter solute-binding subunit [Geminicoccaceae bacterium 1502E]